MRARRLQQILPVRIRRVSKFRSSSFPADIRVIVRGAGAISISTAYYLARQVQILPCSIDSPGQALDYFLRMEAANAVKFEPTPKEILSTFPGVSRIHSCFSIRSVLANRPKGQR